MLVGIITLAFASLIGGALIPFFVKLGVREIPPLTFTFIRFLIAAIFLLPFYIKQRRLKIPSKNSKLFLINSLFFTGNVAFFSIALQFTTAIMSQLVYSLTPLVVGIISFSFLNEKLTRNKVLGASVAFVGLLFLLSRSISEGANTFGHPFGNILLMFGMLSWAGYISISKKLLAKSYNPITINFTAFIATILILSIFIPFELSIRPLMINQITIVGIGSLLGAAIIASVIYFYLIQTGIKLTGAFIASLFQYITPLLTTITAIPLLGEKITTNLILGGIMIIFGVFYATSYSQTLKFIKSKIR